MALPRVCLLPINEHAQHSIHLSLAVLVHTGDDAVEQPHQVVLDADVLLVPIL